MCMDTTHTEYRMRGKDRECGESSEYKGEEYILLTVVSRRIIVFVAPWRNIISYYYFFYAYFRRIHTTHSHTQSLVRTQRYSLSSSVVVVARMNIKGVVIISFLFTFLNFKFNFIYHKQKDIHDNDDRDFLWIFSLFLLSTFDLRRNVFAHAHTQYLNSQQ